MSNKLKKLMALYDEELFGDVEDTYSNYIGGYGSCGRYEYY